MVDVQQRSVDTVVAVPRKKKSDLAVRFDPGDLVFLFPRISSNHASLLLARTCLSALPRLTNSRLWHAPCCDRTPRLGIGLLSPEESERRCGFFGIGGKPPGTKSPGFRFSQELNVDSENLNR